MHSSYLFVYGTLRREAKSPMHQLLIDQSRYVSEACCHGRLYRIGNYPGLLPSANPDDRVRGDLYRVLRPDVLFPALDNYEECGEGFTSPTEFTRGKTNVLLADGRAVEAWVYWYNRPVEESMRIASGDFLKP